MSYVKVRIINKDLLELEQDGKKGDLINLQDLMSIDNTNILKQIELGNEKIYLKKTNEQKELLKLELESKFNEALNKQKQDNLKLQNELKSIVELTKANLEKEHLVAITNKDKDYSNKENKFREEMAELKSKFTEEVSELKNKLSNSSLLEASKYNEIIMGLKNELLNATNNTKTLIETLKLEHENALLKTQTDLKEELNIAQRNLDAAIRDKNTLSVKAIGEDLETWCSNEFNATNLMVSNNITWEKDNEVIDRTKADFIFKVYANDERNENELLTSAILEMKSENKLSSNKQKNSDFYKKLDSDRNKKGLEYAILVSELEMDVTNDLPIRKVNEFEKMYIVRPQYFMTLLNIITAFGMNYKDLLLAKEEERLAFKDEEDILLEFEAMKNEILDNSVKHINTQVDIIVKQSETIANANSKILASAQLILDRHLVTVVNKLNDFRINRIIEKL